MESKYTDLLIPILMKKLYEDNGELPLRKAIHFIRVNSPREVLNTDEDIKHWLDLNSSYFKLQHNTNRIVGITEARLCTKHCSEPGSCRGGCDKLHICRFFILTQKFKCPRECKFNHDLTILHNNYILQKYKLQFLNEEELRRLFRKTENRSQQTLPIICRNFNIGICEKRNCRYLHICKQFILGKCPSGRRCSISHLIDDKIRAIFRSYAIDFENVPYLLHELKLMYSSNKGLLPNNGLFKGISTSDVSVDNSQENYLEKAQQRLYSSHMDLSSLGIHNKTRVKENVNTNKFRGICMKFLFNNCSSECRHHHKQSPYQWQYKVYSENDWKDFDDQTNENLEEKYCHLTDEIQIPSKNGFMRYNFENMEFSSLKTEGKLRRLSTGSSVQYPNNKWNTVWVWYWKNDDECWMKYDTNNPESPALSSEEIEEKYLANRTGQMHFIHAGTVCFIDFKEMFQMNGEKRAVLRRPMFFKEKNIEENAVKPKSYKRREVNRKHINKHNRKVQENNNSELKTDFEIIELEETDSDFEETARKFNETMMARGAKIMSIEIIKNRDLLEEYERRKNKMTEKLGSLSIVNEMDLFHGTESANISIISKQGFDVRLSGGNIGSRYGNGCYFTKNADFAHGYVTPENNLYKMFLANVLVGYSCKGKMSYVRPPLIDPSNEGGDFYNSCVNDVENPNVFVIFTNDQMYPAYIITYTF